MNYTNNQFFKGSGKKVQSLNKLDGSQLFEMHHITSEELEIVLENAVKAKEHNWTRQQRIQCLKKLEEEFLKHKSELIKSLVDEAGKPFSYANGEFLRCIETIRQGVVALDEWQMIEEINVDYGAGKGKKAFIKHNPVGVVWAMSPFNFPLNLALHKIVPAICVGCPIVLKPSPYTIQTNYLLSSILDKIDLPVGFYNMVMLEDELCAKAIQDDRIKKLSFTGSEKVGWYLKSLANNKKVTLELGGNAAVIVHDSKDLRKVAQKVALGAFLYAGQICISTQRIIVLDEIYDRFKKAMMDEVKELLVGDPNEPATIIGPVIDQVHVKRCIDWVKEAEQEGGIRLTEIKIDNNIVFPILIENVNSNSKLWTEEVFGPIAVLKKATSMQQAIELVNDSRFGLQAGVFTNSKELQEKAFEQIDVGAVIINDIPGFRVDGMPYGGVKQSGFGREGVIYAMKEMVEPKLYVE